MPTQKKGYWIEGKRVPSVTTILGRYKESGGLIHWAWQMGMDGVDYRDMRDAAATAGTAAHEMVECFIRDKEFDGEKYDDAILEKADKAYGAFRKWAASTHLKPTETECSLLSTKHRFGGTLDAMLVDDKLSLGDWKTANAVYADNLLQLAGYAILWEENYPNLEIQGGYHLLRFDKEYGDFHHHWYADLEDEKRAFLLLREAYEIDKRTKKRAG